MSARLLALAVLLVPSLLAAQGVTRPLASVRVGQTIRMQLRDGARLEGRVLAADGAHVRLEGRAGPVDGTLVDTLWRRHGGAGRGAAIGAAGGALAGLGFAVFVCERVSEGQGCGAWDAVALITAGGAAGGALLGAAVGSAMPRWSRVYARATPVLGAHGGRWRAGLRLAI